MLERCQDNTVAPVGEAHAPLQLRFQLPHSLAGATPDDQYVGIPPAYPCGHICIRQTFGIGYDEVGIHVGEYYFRRYFAHGLLKRCSVDVYSLGLEVCRQAHCQPRRPVLELAIGIVGVGLAKHLGDETVGEGRMNAESLAVAEAGER